MLAIGPECDIALLSVEDDEFWKDVEPLRFGSLPHLQVAYVSVLRLKTTRMSFLLLIHLSFYVQDDVTVVGYPVGGDTISVTSGVVSRIEVNQTGDDLSRFATSGHSVV